MLREIELLTESIILSRQFLFAKCSNSYGVINSLCIVDDKVMTILI